MNRLIGIASAMLLVLLVLVPGAAAAEPWSWGRSEHVILASGTDVTLAVDQRVDLFVIFSGHARIEGEARTIWVVGGTAELVGAHATDVVAIQSRVTIDGASHVAGDIRTADSTIVGATATTVAGRVRDFGPDVVVGWSIAIGSVLFFIYVAFVVSLMIAGVVLAGIAGRQVRGAARLISAEPVSVVGASLVGLVGLITFSILAIVTVVGIPFGLGLLVLALPGLFVAGYIVAGIWLGEWILERTTPGKVRERPYLAAAVGIGVLGLLSIVPPIGGLISFVGFGAVVLAMWRAVRHGGSPTASTSSPQAVAAAA
jgi:hypothetical protein